MLELKNITVKNGDREIISNASFEIKKGEITVLLGKNGCGKTTLLSCVTGLKKYNGQILYANTDIRKMKSTDRAKRIAILPQILPETALTVESLASLGRNPYVGSAGILSSTDKQAVHEALDASKMTAMAKRAVNSLSGGERQRAFFSMIIAQDAPLILLDEPTAFLDHAARREMYSLLQRLVREKGKTVLAVMHELSEAILLADNLIILDDGRITAAGTRDEILSGKIIEKTFSVKCFECTENGEKRIFFS